jgi:hypothetical protein
MPALAAFVVMNALVRLAAGTDAAAVPPLLARPSDDHDSRDVTSLRGNSSALKRMFAAVRHSAEALDL